MKLVIVFNSVYFAQIHTALHLAFDSLGIAHDCYNSSTFNDADLYILTTVHEGRPLPKRYIAYNFEQIASNRGAQDWLIDRFRQAEEVWDYSCINCAYLRDVYKVRSLFLPLAASPAFHYTLSEECKQFDVLFFGAINARRQRVLQEIQTVLGVSVCFTSNSFGEELERLISQSKLVVNIHYYEDKTVLEVPRILPLVSAGVKVVSETSSDPYYDCLLDGHIRLCNDIVEGVRKSLNDDEAYPPLESKYEEKVKDIITKSKLILFVLDKSV
jgi:hypothetical protein